MEIQQTAWYRKYLKYYKEHQLIDGKYQKNIQKTMVKIRTLSLDRVVLLRATMAKQLTTTTPFNRIPKVHITKTN